MDDKEFTNVLGTIITKHRNEHYPKLSSREFAEVCGLSKSLMSMIENHTHNGNICNTTLNKIAIGLGLSNAMELRELIESYIHTKGNKSNISEDIIISKDSNLYDLFNIVKDFDNDSIQILHNLAVKIKK